MLNRANIIAALLTTVLLAIVLSLSLSATFYNDSMVDVYMALALASAFITLLMVAPSLTNFALVVGFSLIVAGLDFRVMGFAPKPMAAFSFIGLSSLTVLGYRAIWTRNQSPPDQNHEPLLPDRKLLLWAFLPAVLFVASEYMASTLLDYTEALHPKTFDLFLYSFDCSLHVQLSFLIGQIFARHLWFRFVGLLFYISLPLPLALLYAAHLRRKSKNAVPAMLAFLLTGPIGVLFYNMLPATGPIHLFGPAFPWHPLSSSQAMHLALQTVLVKGPRNAIPSLHMAWVLLIWWNSRGLSRWIRAIAFAFVIFTFLATMGIGEHYFVDLVVAFPFSLMVQALCMYTVPIRNGRRRAALLFGAFASLLWMSLLSFATPIFWISPVLPWSMVIASISIPVVLLHRLQTVDRTVEKLPIEMAGKARSSAATA
jgi:PAP2 superfamily